MREVPKNMENNRFFPDWQSFAYKYRGREQAAFEDLARTLFRKEMGIEGGLFHRVNHKGNETDVVEKDGKIIGFQAKYFTNGIKASDIIASMKGAKESHPEQTHYYIYCNLAFGNPRRKKGAKDTDPIPQKTKPEETIEETARELGLTIVWKLDKAILDEANEAEGVYDVFFNVEQKHDSFEELVNSLIKKVDVNNNATIREITGRLNGLISSLHVKTAHDVLLNLRSAIPSSDQYTLSVIDYALGCCSRYVNKESCLAEFDRAYTEMISAERWDADIIGGKLYCLCLENNKTEAMQMANGLKELDRANIWAWIPELVLADDIEEAYSKLPEDIKCNSAVLSNACMIRKQETSLCVDIATYQIDGPEKLEYENIPLWVFNLSVLINRYIREWNADAFTSNTPAGPYCKELYEYSAKYLKLLEKTELGELSPDIALFNSITDYRVNKTASLLEKLKKSKASAQFLSLKQLSYVLFLSKEGKYEEAKQYLNDSAVSSDASIYNIRFYLAVATGDAEYAKSALDGLIDDNVEMPGIMLVFLMMAIKDHPDELGEQAKKVRVADETNAKVYIELCHSFCNEGVDVDFLQKHKNDAALGLRPFIAIALFDAGLKDEALDQSESCVKDGYVDFSSHIYVDLLKKAKAYSRLDTYLRKVREGGFKENHYWLREEYALARKEEDFPRMLSIAEALYVLDAQNPSYFTCYISMQCQNGHFDKVAELSKHIGEYKFTPDSVSQLFNVLLLSDLVEESVEFLFQYIRSNEPNEQLSLLFHSACMNPKTSLVIRKEYDVVEEGLYVYYNHNGERRSDIIVKGQRTDCMIGKKKGETVVVKDRMGRDETFEVLVIYNKYNQLLEEIYKEIHENKYQTAFSFTIDDLTSSGNGNILDGMAKAVGHDEEWQAAHNATLEDYKQGKQSISALFSGDEYIAELYNHLFGTFKVYNIPRNDFEDLYEKRGVSLEKHEFVLDLSALIMLYEIHLKYGVDYAVRFVVPQGIIHLIDATIAKEEFAMPAGIYQSVADKLAVVDEQKVSWFMARLKGMKSWIEESMTVEIAHEMLDVEMGEDSIFEKSRYLALEYQSAALTMRGNRVFVSEDIAMPAAFGKGFPVADVNVFISHFHPDKYVEVSHFFVEADIYGGDIDVDYVMNQYERHLEGDESSYAKCKENLKYCGYLYPVILNFCARLYAKPIITAVDTLTVDTMLKEMFSRYSQKTAYAIMASAYRQLPNMRRDLQMAYRSVYPLMWFN